MNEILEKVTGSSKDPFIMYIFMSSSLVSGLSRVSCHELISMSPRTPIHYVTHRDEFVTRDAAQSNSLYTRSWARASCSMRRSAFHVRHDFVTHQYKFVEKVTGNSEDPIHYIHIHELVPRECIESRLSSRTHIDESRTPIHYVTHRDEFVTRDATQSNSLYTRSWARASCSMRHSAFHVRHEFVTHQYKFVTKKRPSDSLYSRARASCSRRRSAVLCCLRYPEAPVHLNYMTHH